MPASIDVLNDVQKINITMGFPLKNLDFSILIYHIFHIQKQLSKSSKTYYYKDIFNILDFVPLTGKDIDIKENFIKKVKDNKIIYLSEKELSKHLKRNIVFLYFGDVFRCEIIFRGAFEILFKCKTICVR